MTFRYEDNWRTMPINKKINKKIELAETEGFSGPNFVKKVKKEKSKAKKDIVSIHNLGIIQSKKAEKKVSIPDQQKNFAVKAKDLILDYGNDFDDDNLGWFFSKKKKNKNKIKGSKKALRLIKKNFIKKKNILNAQMNGFSNDVDENMGWGIKFKAPKIKVPKIIKKVIAPVKSVVKGGARFTAGLARPVAKVTGRVFKQPLKTLAKPVQMTAGLVGTVTRPVLNVVKSVPVVGKLVDPVVGTTLGVVGMVPLIGKPISSLATDVATSTGVLKPMPVPTGYATDSGVSVEPEVAPAPLLPSPTYTSPAPMVSAPMTSSGVFTSFNRSSSSMPSESSSGGGGGGGGGGGSSSSPSQESEVKEDVTIEKTPIIAPEVKKSNAPKVIGALAGAGALYLMLKD